MDMEAVFSATGDDHRLCKPDMESPKQGSLPRACSETGLKLFGVRITDGSVAMTMRKAVSMGNLSSYSFASSPRSVNVRPSTPEHSDSGEAPGPVYPHGYVSDGLVLSSGAFREKKKGVPWTEEEHRMFLLGLQKLGKGDWRGIARAFVPSRTPTQVASHAQKYFLRQNNLTKRKRRSSLFDMISSNLGSTVCNVADYSGNYSTELNLASSARVSADLCLGTPDNVRSDQHRSQLQRWCHKFNSQQQANAVFETTVPPKGPQRHRLPAMLSSQGIFVESNAKRAKLVSFSSSSAISLSASSASLCRIDEDPELPTGLTLSIGPPHRLEPSAELALKLEQPSIEGSTNNSSTYNNAIPVV